MVNYEEQATKLQSDGRASNVARPKILYNWGYPVCPQLWRTRHKFCTRSCTHLIHCCTGTLCFATADPSCSLHHKTESDKKAWTAGPLKLALSLEVEKSVFLCFPYTNSEFVICMGGFMLDRRAIFWRSVAQESSSWIHQKQWFIWPGYKASFEVHRCSTTHFASNMWKRMVTTQPSPNVCDEPWHLDHSDIYSANIGIGSPMSQPFVPSATWQTTGGGFIVSLCLWSAKATQDTIFCVVLSSNFFFFNHYSYIWQLIKTSNLNYDNYQSLAIWSNEIMATGARHWFGEYGSATVVDAEREPTLSSIPTVHKGRNWDVSFSYFFQVWLKWVLKCFTVKYL